MAEAAGQRENGADDQQDEPDVPEDGDPGDEAEDQ
jgi:hypothetical protein